MRLSQWLIGAFALAVSGSAAAQDDPEAGKALATPCAACHGADGNASVPGSANLAGQNERYLLRQMELFKSGERVAPLMAGQLDGMTEQNLQDLAAYYASLPALVGQAADENLDLGAQIYRGGILEKGVAACSACHSPTGAGNAPAGFPLLSGQPADYLVAQLKAFREGQRDTDEVYGGMMRDVASRLTDSEITAVSNYLRGLH